MMGGIKVEYAPIQSLLVGIDATNNSSRLYFLILHSLSHVRRS